MQLIGQVVYPILVYPTLAIGEGGRERREKLIPVTTVRSGYRIDKKVCSTRVTKVAECRVKGGRAYQSAPESRLLSPRNKRGYAYSAFGACGVTFRYSSG